MNSNDFVTVNQLLADVLITTGDEDIRKGLTKGWYISQIQQALEELAFDTFYQELERDFEIPSNFAIDLPGNFFNVRRIIAFNGTCANPEGTVKLHWKKDYHNRTIGQNYTANRRDDQNASIDPIYEERESVPSNLYYFNVQNGRLMVSSNLSGFLYVRVFYNGMGVDIGEEPIVPRFFRQAVKDWVNEKFWEVMKNRERKHAVTWRETKAKLDDRINGSWRKAGLRMKGMDSAERDSIKEYHSRLNY